jgi:hypothetical protein
MSSSDTEIYLLYQMGVSEEWTWFSPVGVFLSERALWEHVQKKDIASDRKILVPSPGNIVRLSSPQDYVIVKAREGEVPDVEFQLQD